MCVIGSHLQPEWQTMS